MRELIINIFFWIILLALMSKLTNVYLQRVNEQFKKGMEEFDKRCEEKIRLMKVSLEESMPKAL